MIVVGNKWKMSKYAPEGRCYLIELTNVKQNSNHPSQTIHLHLPSIQSVLIMVHFCTVIKMISVEFGLCLSQVCLDL